jgi:hypothetical protein
MSDGASRIAVQSEYLRASLKHNAEVKPWGVV